MNLRFVNGFQRVSVNYNLKLFRDPMVIELTQGNSIISELESSTIGSVLKSQVASMSITIR
jgi:hypothetical protein